MNAENQSCDLSSNPDLGGDPIVNIAAYKFVTLTELDERREQLRQLTGELGLMGTILLSPEGINLFLAGTREGIDQFAETIQQDPEVGELEIKESFTDYQPFKRMLVKLKKEIIAFGVEGIDPAERTSPKLPAKELKKWLDEGKQVTLLDVRNDYEISLGTFEGAEPIGLKHFRHFPEAVDAMPEERKDETIVMFCTGGIRCEKGGPLHGTSGLQKHLPARRGHSQVLRRMRLGALRRRVLCLRPTRRTRRRPARDRRAGTLSRHHRRLAQTRRHASGATTDE